MRLDTSVSRNHRARFILRAVEAEASNHLAVATPAGTRDCETGISESGPTRAECGTLTGLPAKNGVAFTVATGWIVGLTGNGSAQWNKIGNCPRHGERY